MHLAIRYAVSHLEKLFWDQRTACLRGHLIPGLRLSAQLVGFRPIACDERVRLSVYYMDVHIMSRKTRRSAEMLPP